MQFFLNNDSQIDGFLRFLTICHISTYSKHPDKRIQLIFLPHMLPYLNHYYSFSYSSIWGTLENLWSQNWLCPVALSLLLIRRLDILVPKTPWPFLILRLLTCHYHLSRTMWMLPGSHLFVPRSVGSNSKIALFHYKKRSSIITIIPVQSQK